MHCESYNLIKNACIFCDTIPLCTMLELNVIFTLVQQKSTETQFTYLFRTVVPHNGSPAYPSPHHPQFYAKNRPILGSLPILLTL